MTNKNDSENSLQTSKARIPVWVNIFQVILTLIMLSQVFMYYFNHDAIRDAGISVDGVPMLNLVYEMGARTAVMAAAAIFVLITQDPKQFLVVLFMNVLREGQEMVIDPLYPMLNAPASPVADFVTHAVIVALEILAFINVGMIVNKRK
ncbi:MAG: hypothetical protein AAF551_06075 [Bacteroidota bacterium]